MSGPSAMVAQPNARAPGEDHDGGRYTAEQYSWHSVERAKIALFTRKTIDSKVTPYSCHFCHNYVTKTTIQGI